MSLSLQRTRSMNSLPRIRSFVQLIVALMISIGLIVMLLHWKKYLIIFWPKKLRESDEQLSVIIANATTVPQLIFQETLRQPVGRGGLLRLMREAQKHTELCKEIGVFFRIILIVPEDSLKRLDSLLEQLRRMDYFQCVTHLQFLLPPGDDGMLAAYVDQLVWPYGKVYSGTSDGDNFMKDNFLSSWSPDSDHEFAIIFDDIDCSVKVEAIEWALLILHRYFLDIQGQRTTSTLARSMAGLSFGLFTPPTIEGRSNDCSITLSQVPLGILLLVPWFWAELTDYSIWRQDHPAPPLPYQSSPNVLEASSLWKLYF